MVSPGGDPIAGLRAAKAIDVDAFDARIERQSATLFDGSLAGWPAAGDGI